MGLRALSAVKDDEHRAQLLTEVAVTEAARSGAFDVVGNSDVQALVGFERQRQLLGCGETSSCITELAGALDAVVRARHGGYAR